MLSVCKVPFKKIYKGDKTAILKIILDTHTSNKELKKEKIENIKNSLYETLLKNNLLDKFNSNFANMDKKQLKEYILQNYPIQTGLNNPILRKKSVPVDINKIQKLQDFAHILFEAMQIYDGIWLAAPQIWKNIRMIAVCQLDKSEKNVIWADVLINPKIIEKKWEYIGKEACLSLPWLEWEVKRYKKVKVEYYDVLWQKKVIDAENLNAVILQHEIDHLDGILFWDKVINKWEPNFLKNYINL